MGVVKGCLGVRVVAERPIGDEGVGKGDEPGLFGDVLRVPTKERFAMLRPVV